MLKLSLFNFWHVRASFFAFTLLLRDDAGIC
jgi:hypothetical protein